MSENEEMKKQNSEEKTKNQNNNFMETQSSINDGQVSDEKVSSSESNRLKLEKPQDKQENRQREKKREKKGKFTYIFWIVVTIVLFVAGSIFALNDNIFHTKPTILTDENRKDNHYTILVSQWNEAVIKSDLKDSFLLPRDDSQQVIDKLNNLLKAFSGNNNQTSDLSKLRNNKDALYLPIHEYFNFIKKNKTLSIESLNTNSNEEEIIMELKKITHSNYINNKMLLTVAYMNDFQIYFERNLNSFYREGFTRNITEYQQYIDTIL